MVSSSKKKKQNTTEVKEERHTKSPSLSSQEKKKTDKKKEKTVDEQEQVIQSILPQEPTTPTTTTTPSTPTKRSRTRSGSGSADNKYNTKKESSQVNDDVTSPPHTVPKINTKRKTKHHTDDNDNNNRNEGNNDKNKDETMKKHSKEDKKKEKKSKKKTKSLSPSTNNVHREEEEETITKVIDSNFVDKEDSIITSSPDKNTAPRSNSRSSRSRSRTEESMVSITQEEEEGDEGKGDSKTVIATPTRRSRTRSRSESSMLSNQSSSTKQCNNNNTTNNNNIKQHLTEKDPSSSLLLSSSATKRDMTTTTTKISAMTSNSKPSGKKRRKNSITSEQQHTISEDIGMNNMNQNNNDVSSSEVEEGHEKKASATVPPTLGVLAHRLRPPNSQSLYYTPSTILCMASIPTTTSSASNGNNGLLAISYENGTIELKCITQKLRTIAIVPGFTNMNITCMTWIQMKQSDYVLVGCTASGLICIINFDTCSITHVTPSGGGGIFCIANLCGSSNSSSSTNKVAIGNEDGIIRIADINLDNKLLDITSSLSTAGASILSLACYYDNNKNNKQQATTIYAGVADGTIRRYDYIINNNNNTNTNSYSSSGGGYWKSTIRMTIECWGITVPTKVWALKVLQNDDDDYNNDTQTLISGDSLGHVQIWNGNTGTLEYTFDQNDIRADVFSLDVSMDNTKIFASGIYPRVICIERTSSSNNKRWVLTNAHQPHTHDVKAVSIVQYYDDIDNNNSINTPDFAKSNMVKEALITGGLDTKLCVYSVSDFSRQRPKIIFPIPTYTANPTISIAHQARYMTVIRGSTLDIYQLAHKLSTKEIQESRRHRRRALWKQPKNVDNLICTIQLDGAILNLLSCSINLSGQYLAATDVRSLLLFHLQKQEIDNDDGDYNDVQYYHTLIPTRIDTGKDLLSILGKNASITAISFLSENILAMATSSSAASSSSLSDKTHVHVVSIESTSSNHDNKYTCTVFQSIAEVPTVSVAGTSSKEISSTQLILPIHTISATSDGNWFFTTRHATGGGVGSQLHDTATVAINQIQIYCRQTSTTTGPYQPYWTLPYMHEKISAVSFLQSPTSCNKENDGINESVLLAVACINYSIYIFDVKNRRLHSWSEQAGYPLRSIPTELQYYRYDFPLRLAMNPATPSKILVGTVGKLISINIEEQYPTNFRFWPENHVRAYNRRRNYSSNNNYNNNKRIRALSFTVTSESDGVDNDNNIDETNNNNSNQRAGAKATTATVFLKYNNMLYMNFIDPDEMVVVEQSWMNVLETLPDPLERKVYGT